MPACLLDNFTVILSLMVVKSLKPVLILFFKTVPFSCIRTDSLYRYHFSIFVLILCIDTVFLFSDIYYTYYLTCYYLTHDSCLFSPDTYLISLITCHDWYLTYNYHNMEMMTWHLDISWYIYTHTHTHTYIYTHTHTYIPVQSVLQIPLYSWHSRHVPAHSHALIII